MEMITYILLAGLMGIMVLVAYLRYRIVYISRLPQSPDKSQGQVQPEPPPAHVDDRYAPSKTALRIRDEPQPSEVVDEFLGFTSTHSFHRNGHGEMTRPHPSWYHSSRWFGHKVLDEREERIEDEWLASAGGHIHLTILAARVAR